MTGGVLHVSGGATRALLTFEGKKIAPRTFEITLPSLGTGDYGLLPPASTDPNASSGRIGKIFHSGSSSKPRVPPWRGTPLKTPAACDTMRM
jgi:hypothetical protein